jgi:hypothetical protein
MSQCPADLLGGCAFLARLDRRPAKTRQQIGGTTRCTQSTRCSATQQDQMPVNDFMRLFGVVLPNYQLSWQNGFPSIDLILLDLEVRAAQTRAERQKSDARDGLHRSKFHPSGCPRGKERTITASSDLPPRPCRAVPRSCCHAVSTRSCRRCAPRQPIAPGYRSGRHR